MHRNNIFLPAVVALLAVLGLLHDVAVAADEGFFRRDLLFGNAGLSNKFASEEAKEEFRQYKLGQDTYGEHYTYGVGDEFVLWAMQSALVRFTLTDHSVQTSMLRFEAMTRNRITCRLKGYLDHCNHPFGNDVKTHVDVQEPFHVDFAITDEPMDIPSIAGLVNLPLFVFGITPVYNLPGINELILSKDIIARIFRGCDDANPDCLPNSITYWGHPDIKAINPESIHALLDSFGTITVVVDQQSDFMTDGFKSACGSFEDAFSYQIGSSIGTADWPGCDTHIKRPGFHAMLKHCSGLPGCITYTRVNGITEQRELRTITLQNVGNTFGETTNILPTTETLHLAFSEIGLEFEQDSFGNREYQVELTGARGERAWPISFLTYLTFVSDDYSENCLERRSALLTFIEYLYMNQGPVSKVLPEGIAGMTDNAALEVLEVFRANFKCNGTAVYEKPSPKPRVIVHAEPSIHKLIAVGGRAFDDAEIQVASLQSHLTLREKFACQSNISCFEDMYINDDRNAGMLVVADENLSSYILRDDEMETKYKLLSVPFCAVATGLIYNFCPPLSYEDDSCEFSYETPLTLTIEIAAMILDEQITYWNDSRIQALNIDKVLPPEKIHVVAGPRSSTYFFDFVTLIRRAYISDFSHAGGGEGEETYEAAWVEVNLTPYSISYVPFNGTAIENVERASLVNGAGKVVPPSPANIEACTHDTYNAITGVFYLSSSMDPDCWPLVQTYNIFMLQHVHNPMPARFAKFLFDETVRTIQKDGEILIHDNSTDANTVVTMLNAAKYGTLVDANTNDGINVAVRNFEALESIVDENLVSVIRVHHDFNHIPRGLIVGLYVIMSLELFTMFALGVWGYVHSDRKLVRNSSPVFMYMVLFGCMLMAVTVVPLSQQDSFLPPRGMLPQNLNKQYTSLNAACAAAPITFSAGFFIAYSALFLKSWRLIKIFNNKKLKNIFLKDRQLLMYQAAVIFVVVILNLIWVLQSPLEWHRTPVFIDGVSGLVVDSVGICHSPAGIYPALPLAIGIMLVLFVGNYLSYLGRRIPTEFNESRWTTMAMAFTLEAFVIGLLVLILAYDQPVPGFIIKAFCCLLVPGITVAMIFGPKVAMAYGIGLIEGESNPWRFVKKGESGSGSANKDTGGKNSNNGSKMAPIVPSLNSLVDTRVVVQSNEKLNNSSNPAFHSRFGFQKSINKKNNSTSEGANRSSKNLGYSSPTEALAQVLHDDPMRRRFRRYLQTLKMEENVRFWDSIQMFRNEPDPYKRFVNARAIVQTFVLDSSPLQVNLSSRCQKVIVDAYNHMDKAAMGSIEFFSAAANELFEDLRQSDAFRIFMDNDTFSQVDIGSTSKSDPLILVNDAALGASLNQASSVAPAEPSNGSGTQLAPAMPL